LWQANYCSIIACNYFILNHILKTLHFMYRIIQKSPVYVNDAAYYYAQ